LVSVRFSAAALHDRFARNRGVFELSWSRELTMLASLGAELLVLTRCAVGGGCGLRYSVSRP
jgi:hypothetical protein